ncbi:hypothetical protein AAG906_001768 [Vitis piasezkii]
MGESYASRAKEIGIIVVQNNKERKFLHASLQVGGVPEKTIFTCPFETYAYRKSLSTYAMHRQHSKDASKVELIVKLPSPTTVKGVRQFLGHVGFYRRFIKDFSKLARPLCELLLLLTTAPIVRAPNWQLPFEVMCDASDFAIGVVLGQREDGKPYVIYYASKTLAIAHNSHSLPINDDFPEESLMLIEVAPWYAHIANYLVTREVPIIATKAHVEATLLLRRQL